MGKGIGQLVSWLATIYVIRLLAPEDYGLLAMAMLLITFGQMMTSFGFTQNLVRVTEITPRLLNQTFSALTLINFASYALIFFLAPYVAEFFDEPQLTLIIRILALLFPLSSFTAIPSAMLSRKMAFKTKAKIGVITSIVSTCVTLLCAIDGLGVWSLILGNLLSTLAAVLIHAWVGRILYSPTLNFHGFYQHFSYGSLILGGSFMKYIEMKSANLLIAKVLGSAELGVYSVGQRLATLPMAKINGILSQIGLAAFSRAQTNMQKFRRNYLEMMSILSFFAFPVFWGIASVTDWLVPVVLGDQWIEAIIPMKLLAIAAPFRMMFENTTPALMSIGRADTVLRNRFFFALTMTLGYICAIPYGIVGIATVWALLYPVLFFIIQIRAMKILGINYLSFVGSIFCPMIICCIMMAIVFSMSQIPQIGQINNPLTLTIMSVTGGTFYIIASFLIDRKTFLRSKNLIF